LSPDWSAIPEPVPYANLTNPQTLNLYQYVEDDPETFADLDGHTDSGENGQNNNKSAQTSTTTCGQAALDATGGCTTTKVDANHPPQQQNNGQRQQNNQDQNQQNQPIQMSGGKGGGQGKGERRITGKPEFQGKPGKLPKGVRVSHRHPDQYEVRDPHTRNWVEKPKGWSPTTTQRVIAGAAAGAVTGYIIYRVVRMLPSVAIPPLWPTIPANALIP